MSVIDIRVEGLGKAFRINRRQQGKRYRTLQEDVLALPRRLLATLRGTPAGEDGREETFWALQNLSFEVRQGEVLGIIGRNGAGKSTLLKILSRITEPTRGRAEIYGRVGSLLEVGTGFHPELTGRENVYLSGAILGMRRGEIARRFDEIVAFAGVEQFIDTPVKRYSSGMYMRLAFAVAAHLETEILVVDEVLSVGDSEFQRKCLNKMDSVAATGRTVLFVSHQMDAVEQLCSRAILLQGGRIAADSSDVRAVIRNYAMVREQTERTVWCREEDERGRNGWFDPIRFAVTDAHGEPLVLPVRNDSEIRIRIDAEIGIPDPALTVGYALYTEEGTLLHWSCHTDGQRERWPVLARGTCTLWGSIPSRFLNEGSYRIELIGGLYYQQWLFEPGRNVPSISLTIEGGLSQSPYWVARRPGLLAPVLAWWLGDVSSQGDGDMGVEEAVPDAPA